MSTVTTSDWSQFCDGLAYAGNRDLAPAEIATISGRARRMLTLAVSTLVVMWGIAAGVAAVAFVHPFQGSGVGVLATIIGVVLVALGFLLCNDLASAGRRLRRDAKQRVVARYASLPSSTWDRELEVLPTGHVNWSARGYTATRWKKTPPFREPRQPQYNPFTGTWVVPSRCLLAGARSRPESEAQCLAQSDARDMRDDGRKALQRIVRAYAIRTIVWTALLGVWLAMVFGHGVAQAQFETSFVPSAFLLALALGSRSVWSEHRRDLASGQAMVSVWTTDNRSDPPSPPLGYLPCSNALWTVDGTPADWRSKPMWRVQSPVSNPTAEVI